MSDRALLWVGSALDDLREFPDDARRAAGYQLHRLQQGLMPTDFRPLKAVGRDMAIAQRRLAAVKQRRKVS